MVGKEEAVETIQTVFDTEITQITEIHKGTNTTYKVSIDSNTYIIKYGTFDRRSVRIEPYILGLLDRNNIPVAKVEDIGEQNGIPYFIMSFISGNELDYPQHMDFNGLLDASFIVGKLLAKIQKIEFPPGTFRVENGELTVDEEDWKVFFKTMIEKFITQARGNYPSLSSQCRRLAYWDDIPEIEMGVFSPLDLHTGNIIVGNDFTVNGVIDFERCYIAHPRWSYEVTKQTLYSGRSIGDRKRIEEAFENGYESISSLPEYYPLFELMGVLREMRAAHIWWDNPSSEKQRLMSQLDDIEEKFKQSSN